MELTLRSVDDLIHYEITNEDGVAIHTDSSADEGGQNRGFRPMQLVLAGLASCSSIDIQHILKKQRQPIEGLQARVTGQRATDETPAVFRAIHVHYIVQGAVDPAKAERAASLSLEKYCSVAKMLASTATITHSVEVVEAAAEAE
jgi:putative redox protein